MNNVYYLNIVQYRRIAPPGIMQWGLEVLQAFNNQVGLPNGSGQAIGPKPADHGNELWPVLSGGLREITTRVLAVSELIEAMRHVPEDATCFTLGATRRGAKDKFFDMAWTLQGDHPPRWSLPPVTKRTYKYLDGRAIDDTTLVLSVNCILLDKVMPEIVRTAILDVLACAASYRDCYYSFVTVDDAAKTTGGTLYTPTIIGPYDPRAQQEELGWWRHDVDRIMQARGAYWGNVFGPKLAAACDAEGVTKRIADLSLINSLDHSVGPVSIQRLSDESLFIELTNNPLDARPSNTGYGTYCLRRDELRSILREHHFIAPHSTV